MLPRVSFGFGVKYGSNQQKPSVAINNALKIVEVHAVDSSYDLFYRFGTLNGPAIDWKGTARYDSGVDPAVAASTSVVVEVHNSEKSGNTDDLWMRVGPLAEPIVFKAKEQYDTGRSASVAVSDRGVIIEVHQHPDEDKIYYCLATTNGASIEWKQRGKYITNGSRPRVAINSSGLAVVTFERNGRVFTIAGWITDAFYFGEAEDLAAGYQPAVALTEENVMVVVYQGSTNDWFTTPLFQLTRHLDNGAWETAAPQNFDTGMHPSVAAAGRVAVQVHQSEVYSDIYFSNSLLNEPVTWMSDRLDVLSDVPLNQLVLPASHDSSMYRSDGIEFLGQTQDLSVFDQLGYGIRWFDLRPLYDSATGTIYMWHGDKTFYVTGPTLADILQQLTWFFQNRPELVLLKFSHFSNFNDAAYDLLQWQVTQALDRWLVKKTPGDKRLADVTLGEYIGDGTGAALVVMDSSYFYKNRIPGLWFYRDWDKDDAANGDLRVFDEYSETIFYDTMKADQIDKFNKYTGVCKKVNEPCDLFLLSWTLTPPTGVWYTCGDPNRYMGEVVQEQMTIPNQYKMIPNLLYTDYVEYSRITDIALWLNDAAI
jgi:hypothetical protein